MPSLWSDVRKIGTSGQNTGSECNEEVQNQENKTWKNEELTKLEEDMTRLTESALARAATTCKTKTGVGCDGFRWTWQEEQEKKWWNYWRKSPVADKKKWT